MFSLLLSSNQRRLLLGVEKSLQTFTEIQEKITLVAGQDFSATTKKFQMSNNMQWMSRCSCLNRLPSFSKILLLIMTEDYFTNTTQYFCQIHIHMYRAFSAISLQILLIGFWNNYGNSSDEYSRVWRIMLFCFI